MHVCGMLSSRLRFPCPPPQCLHPRGQRPLPTGAAAGFTPSHPRGSGPGLAPAQPVLDRLRRQVHLRGLGGRHQEAGPHQHRPERTPQHSAGSPPRVRKTRRPHGCPEWGGGPRSREFLSLFKYVGWILIKVERFRLSISHSEHNSVIRSRNPSEFEQAGMPPQ